MHIYSRGNGPTWNNINRHLHYSLASFSPNKANKLKSLRPSFSSNT